MTISDSFKDYLERQGFVNLPESIPVGKYITFQNGSMDESSPAWLVLTKRGIGFAEDVAEGKKIVFAPKWDDGRELTDREKIQRTDGINQAHIELGYIKVAYECQTIWDGLFPANNKHPFLVHKGIVAIGIKQTLKEDSIVLVVPLVNDDGLQSLEYIYPDMFPGTDRNTMLHKRGRTEGVWFQIGTGSPSFLTTSYESACSIYMATGKPVVMTYSAKNIPHVAERFPNACIVADNELYRSVEKSANEAKALYGNKVILIPELQMTGNDYATIYGLESLKNLLIDSLIEKKMFIRGNALLNNQKPIQWLIRDWIPEGKNLLELYGTSGSGKTFLTLDLMLSICTGQPEWFGNKVRPGKVIYFFGEGERGLRNRMAYWIQEHGGQEKLDSLLSENFMACNTIIALDDPSKVKEVKQQIKSEDFNPNLIVFDTLNRFSGAADENSSKDMTGFISACDDLAKTFDCAVLLIHHTGWSEEAKKRGRGSSVVRASVDMDYLLESKGDGVLCLSQTKNKDSEVSDPLYMRIIGGSIDGQFDDDGFPIRSAIIVQTEKPEEPKTQRQSNYEQLAISAFREHGYIEDDRVCIKRKKLLQFLDGKLTGKDGKPYDKSRLQTELNPNQQGKFVGLLVNKCFMETIQGAEKTPDGWRLSPGSINKSVMDYIQSQTELNI